MIDRDLVERCRRGDREAQHEVYSRTAERVYRLVLRIAGHADDAFDIAQETYVRAFTRIAQFDGRSSFPTWLCRIAVNEALQFQRKASGRAKRESNAAGNPVDRTDNSPDTRLDVRGALAQLPQADRAILLLRYQEGLDYQTIAEALDCEPGTVGSRLNRARERLRDFLKTGYSEGEGIAAHKHPIERGTGDDAAPDCSDSGAAVRGGTGP